MKTKKYLLAIAALFATISWADNVNAQDLFSHGDTIRGNGFTYIAETPWAEDGVLLVTFPENIRLRNIDNMFTGVGQKINGEFLPGMYRPKSYDDDDDVYEKFGTIINSVFSSTDKNNIAGDDLLIVELHIDSTTGKIVDVEYQVDLGEGFTRVAPEKYYQIETMLKQQVTYQINSIGRQYNFNYDFWWYKGDEFR